MKKLFLTLTGFFLWGISWAQVGININNPDAFVDIIGSNLPKAIRAENNSGKEVLTLLNNGSIGLGITTPTVLLDLRDGSNDSAIGIGSTNEAANISGEGALQYDTKNSALAYSDGVKWNSVAANTQKAVVTACIKSSTQLFPSGSDTPISGWDDIKDNKNTFNGLTSTFTAPNYGIFTASVSLTFDQTAVTSNSFVKISITSSSGTSVKGVKSFQSSGNVFIGVLCSGSFELNYGETISVSVSHNLGVNASLYGNEFNNISIIES